MNNAPAASTNTEWLPVAVAAARLGVSERTVQRRAEKGKIESKEVSDAQGKRLLIRLDVAPEVPTPDDRLTTGADAQSNVPTLNDKLTPQPDDISVVAAANVPTPADTINATFLAHVLEENKFLRAALEQRDRDAAELRAALREALKLSSRQLTSGTAETATVASDGPEIAQVNNVSPTPPEPEKRPPATKAEPPKRGDALAKIRDGLRGLFTR
jgi:hypothetical protein